MPAAPFHAKIEEMPRDGDENAVGPGELLYLPAGMPFLGRVIGDEVVLNLDVFAPAREDDLYLAAHQTGKEARGS
jgi:hypothetical protein